MFNFTNFSYVLRHLDDPIGALSVHLVGGIWGNLARFQSLQNLKKDIL